MSKLYAIIPGYIVTEDGQQKYVHSTALLGKYDLRAIDCLFFNSAKDYSIWQTGLAGHMYGTLIALYPRPNNDYQHRLKVLQTQHLLENS